MNIEPKTLNIPLHRNERWGFTLAVLCACAVAVAWLFKPAFALPFTVSCAVVLPSLWLFFFPPHRLRGKLPRFVVYALLLGYLALSKVVVIPLLTTLLHTSASA